MPWKELKGSFQHATLISRASSHTRIPVLESKRNSQSSNAGRSRRRHVAGNGNNEPVKKYDIQEIYDTKVQSKAVLPTSTAKSGGESDMDSSSVGILSPSEMKSSGIIMTMTASQASNQGWTTTMIRSRTFTRDLNDPQAENEMIVEDLETSTCPRTPVKKFSLNTTQIEADDETSMLMSRTEELLQSKFVASASSVMMAKPVQDRFEDYPDINDTLKLRTESLLHSKTRRKKKTKAKASSSVSRVQDQMVQADSSGGSSWSNIPRCFNVTTSMLSSDAGISSMPSSMISNISESEHQEFRDTNDKTPVMEQKTETTKELYVPDIMTNMETQAQVQIN